ncbi:hypothetical protein EJB05_21253, partial [Eragrostis curvula]
MRGVLHWIVTGLMVDGCYIKSSEAGQGRFFPCPMYCLNAAYMTCTSSGGQHLEAVCNCCVVKKKGCTICLNNRQPMKKGIASIVLEKSETLRADGSAIGIYVNGWRVLVQLGVAAELRETANVITA